jgi:hypothetical protein
MSELAVVYLVPSDGAEAPHVLFERHGRRRPGNSTARSIAR